MELIEYNGILMSHEWLTYDIIAGKCQAFWPYLPEIQCVFNRLPDFTERISRGMEFSEGFNSEFGKKVTMTNQGLSIVVPVYNEEGMIGQTIRELSALVASSSFPVEVIVVDDGSNDGTNRILPELSAENVRVVRHPINRGYGASLKTGILCASYSVIAITDADGTYPNERIPELFEQLCREGYDMVVGARTGSEVEIPRIRRPAKWILNKIADYLAGFKIPDLNSGLRIFKKDVVRKFFAILPEGFSFTTTITLAMLTNGYRVAYVPINYKKRGGKSKIRPFYDTLNFLQLIIRTILYFNPLKIFLPISGFFILLSLLLLFYRIFVAKAFGVTSVILFVCGIQFLGLGMLADLIDRRM